ncbi:MAG TPA: phosphatase PAP2 family protein [Symbiobacteriaceae bacterium]|nr:phosphatase PAP2 family protein [Symbiobacteriaceae bacterium]
MTGLDMIRAIQTIQSPFMDRLFLFMSGLHGELLYLLVLPLLYWLYDKRFARHLATVFVLGNWSNDVLKNLFNTARPLASDVRVLRPEPSGAFPSGHSQNPLLFWGTIALEVNRRWLTAVVAVVVVLIGISRLYIGVHWPLDILGGWTLGALMLWGFAKTRSFWSGENQPFRTQLLWAVVLPAVVLIITLLLGQLPAMSTPKAALTTDLVRFLGVYFGFSIGAAVESEFVGFDPRRGSRWVQVVKVVLGIALLLAVKEGTKLFIPATALGEIFRYALIAMTVSLGAPWVFKRFAPAPPAGTQAA